MQATLSPPVSAYPVRVEGHFEHPSRGLWLIKWLLVIPHYLVLAFLWLAFVVSSMMAFGVMLFTGRYPTSLFGFNVGVLRWSWRVAFYAFGANGTDRYPPFTLDDVVDYPARLEIDYPAHQRKGLALVGWWLAGIPQYVIAGVFIGGGGAAGWTASTRSWGGATWLGLIGLLVLVAVVVLLFRGEYPRSIFDLVLGLNRWVLRVTAYAAVMTREYPPFRIDIGEQDPAGTLTVAPPRSAARVESEAEPGERRPTSDDDAEERIPTISSRGRRTAALVFASIAMLGGLAVAIAGGTLLALDRSDRDASGYLMTAPATYSTNTYALVSDNYRAGTASDWFITRDLLGTVRIRANSARPIFIGVAPAAAVNAYLGNVARDEAPRFDAPRPDFLTRQGTPPSAPPTAVRIWAASVVGAGNQTLAWPVKSGEWRIVVMNADGSSNIAAKLSVGARFPHLLTIAIAALGFGILALSLGVAELAIALRRKERSAMDDIR